MAAVPRWAAALASLVVHLMIVYFVRVDLSLPVALPAFPHSRSLPFTLILSQPPARKPLRRSTPPIIAKRSSDESQTIATPAADPDTGTTSSSPQITPSAAPAARGASRSFGDGRLWVRPLNPAELAMVHRLTRSSAQLADSAVKAMVQAYLDSMAIELARQPGPPNWTTQLGGKKFGVDAQFVYIGGLKIPTLLLALLPIPSGGNQSLAFDRGGQMFDDLTRAAARSATLEEFKSAVKALRERSEQEHQLRQAQQQGSGPEEAPLRASGQ